MGVNTLYGENNISKDIVWRLSGACIRKAKEIDLIRACKGIVGNVL